MQFTQSYVWIIIADESSNEIQEIIPKAVCFPKLKDGLLPLCKPEMVISDKNKHYVKDI